jgi:predicted nucleotidyltransferase
MRTLEGIRSELRAMLPDLRPRWPITRLGVFGSYARGGQHEDGDLDLLVDLDRSFRRWLLASRWSSSQPIGCG